MHFFVNMVGPQFDSKRYIPRSRIKKNVVETVHFSLQCTQCGGSGSESESVGSICFGASRIRIRLRILLSLSKNSKKNIDWYCFVTSL
jgi:hypothetical protein